MFAVVITVSMTGNLFLSVMQIEQFEVCYGYVMSAECNIAYNHTTELVKVG